MDKHLDKEITVIVDDIQKQINEAMPLLGKIVDSMVVETTKAGIDLFARSIDLNARLRVIIERSHNTPKREQAVRTQYERNAILKERMEETILKYDDNPKMKMLVDLAKAQIPLLDKYNLYLKDYVGETIDE